MKKWWRKALSLMVVLLLIPVQSFAVSLYLIPDSDTRHLTEEELWAWDYESLGYILNEIFARHGYNFIPGEKYDNYFRCMDWYRPNASANNQQACYPQLTKTEWDNESLVKEVRAKMRAAENWNEGGKSVWDYFHAAEAMLQGFDLLTIASGQMLSVYSAPDASSWRGANGKAQVSTEGSVFAAGWESGWLLVMYETNNGSIRVGYVNGSDMKGAVSNNKLLTFAYDRAVVAADCQLTDDPGRCYAPIMTLKAGATVTYLSTFINQNGWDYIETSCNGQRVRGFIPSGRLNVADEDK